MPASSSDRSDAGAPTVAETSLATRTATRPYIESMIESLRQAGDRPVLRWDGADTTGSQLLAAIYRYARALESLGIARGDLVAMYAPNRPEALAVRYATHLLGAASVYLSAPPASGKRAQMLVDFRPGLVVVFPETANLLPPTTAPCVAIGPVEDVPLRLDELASEQDTAPMESRARQDELAVVVSSGAVWRGGGTWSPGLIIAHNDAATYNAAWHQGKLTGFFDWDFAGPGTPAWDLAFAAFSWVPLHSRHVVAAEGFTDFTARPRRLDRFLHTYGWSATTGQFLDVVQARVTAHADGIRDLAASGDPAFGRLLRQGIPDALDQAVAELASFPR